MNYENCDATLNRTKKMSTSYSDRLSSLEDKLGGELVDNLFSVVHLSL